MKKIYNLFAFLFVIGMLAAGFVSCSNPSGSGSASNEAAGKEVAVYESATDRVTLYDDNTWVDIYKEDKRTYCRGTYKLASGDFDNGEITFTITYSISSTVSTGDYGVRIKKGKFFFFYDEYWRVK